MARDRVVGRELGRLGEGVGVVRFGVETLAKQPGDIDQVGQRLPLEGCFFQGSGALRAGIELPPGERRDVGVVGPLLLDVGRLAAGVRGIPESVVLLEQPKRSKVVARDRYIVRQIRVVGVRGGGVCPGVGVGPQLRQVQRDLL